MDAYSKKLAMAKNAYKCGGMHDKRGYAKGGMVSGAYSKKLAMAKKAGKK